MKGTVTSLNMKEAIRAISVIDKGLAKEWRAEARDKVTKPWAEELARQAPLGMKGAAAGRSIKAGTGAVPIVYAGKGSWNGWQPFFATEFGMSHTQYHTYIRRNRTRPGRHVVRRRSGTWANPHLGSHGYWFSPYWAANEERLRQKVITLADDFIGRSL